MRKKTLIFVFLLVASFICGIVVAPLLQEVTYSLKEWTGKPIFSPPPSEVITLYFSASDEEFLVPVERKIVVGEGVNNQIKAVLQELIKGPQDTNLSPTLSPQTKIRAVYTKDKIIYVDFSSSFMEKHPGGTSAELVSIYSVVNTILDNFPSYSQVQILINGEPRQTLAGHIDIRGPFTKNEKIVRK